MREFARFLRARPLWWIVPILALFGALAWLARVQALAPDAPFTYRL
jgi:hypothetical protein